jgi:hypothetical protein
MSFDTGIYNPEITLEPSSLYVATQQLVDQPGKYHWAIYGTDSSGVATKYHWAIIRRDGRYSRWAEGVKIQQVPSVRTYSAQHIATLAFFRLNHYQPLNSSSWEQLAMTIWPEEYQYGFETVDLNRENGIS